MRVFKSVAGVVGVAVVAMALIGCGGTKSLKGNYGSAKGASGVYPEAIEKLLSKKLAKSINGVGMATHPDQAIALEKADLNADQQIAKQFEMEVSSLQKKFIEAVNDQKLEEYRNTVENFVNIKLQGVTKVKELTAEGKDGYKAWVLKTVSPEVLKEMIDQRTNALTSFKALQAYKDLEDRVAKDKAARESNE